jgi:2-polyprenyl-3-methyl-5-hydroxy-6-metoxy-1,4-benzoquinol methylase
VLFVIQRVLIAAGQRVPSRIARAGFVLLDALGWRYTVPGERSDCPACGARGIEHLHPLGLHDRSDGRRVGFASGCPRCGIVFANPMPPEEALVHMYSPDGRWGQTHQHEPDKTHASSRYLARMLAPVQSAFDVARPAPGSTVLDFGCGSGELLDTLQDFGWTTYGIEPAVKSAFVRHRELTAIPTSPTFDLAVAHHVLEHVRNPLDILRALSGCLRPGGLLFVSVPRLDTLAQHRDFRYCVNDRAHVVSYTRDAMATLMGMAGLEAIDLNPAPGDDRGGWRALKRMRMLGRKGGPPAMPAEPLHAARHAFSEWLTADPEAIQRRSSRMSVRAAAAVMNFERALRSRRRPPSTRREY